jgi:hypothetical protein
MRRGNRVMGAVAVAFALGGAGATGLNGTAGASTTAQAEYKAALRAAGSESVHYVSKAIQDGVALEVVGDTGTTAGSQVLVIESGTTIETLEIVLVRATGYVRGNATALQKIMGLSAAQSTTYANTWLSFPATDANLADLVGGLRNKDVATELAMTGPYTFGPTKKIGGHSTQGIGGFANTATSTKIPIELYVESGSIPRPVEEVTNPGKDSKTIEGTVTFSKWGEKNHTTAPSHSVPLASLAPSAG